MAKNIPAKLQFLDEEMNSLRARIGSGGNSVQISKLEMLADIRDDYRAAVDRAKTEKSL